MGSGNDSLPFEFGASEIINESYLQSIQDLHCTTNNGESQLRVGSIISVCICDHLWLRLL